MRWNEWNVYWLTVGIVIASLVAIPLLTDWAKDEQAKERHPELTGSERESLQAAIDFVEQHGGGTVSLERRPDGMLLLKRTLADSIHLGVATP